MIIKLDRLGIKVTLRLQNRSPQKLENVLNNFHLQSVCPICCTSDVESLEQSLLLLPCVGYWQQTQRGRVGDLGMEGVMRTDS